MRVERQGPTVSRRVRPRARQDIPGSIPVHLQASLDVVSVGTATLGNAATSWMASRQSIATA